MNPIQPNRSDRQPLSESDERAIDALMGEVQQLTPTPPDLTEAILRHLAQQDWEKAHPDHGTHGPAIASAVPHAASPGAPKHRRSLLICGAAALALAASVMLLLSRWERPSPESPQTANNGAASQSAEPTGPQDRVGHQSIAVQPQPSPAAVPAAPQDSPQDTDSPLPRQGVPLVRTLPLTPSEGELATAPSQETALERDERVSADVGDLLVRLDTALASYWSRLGVTPAMPLDETQWADRVQDRFGTSLEFADPQGSAAFAARLVDRLMRDVPLAANARKIMVEQAAEVIHSGGRFDELLSRWVADDSLLDARKPDLLSQGLATNLLGVDAACARCHDSPVDGRFAQHDYWSLASVFSPARQTPLFYELVDGRQRVADVQLPERWMGDPEPHEQESAAQDSAEDLKQRFAQSLVGNRALASSLANRLWEIAFDAPLVSRASDPLAPPRDDALQASHEVMTDAILASEFDIRVAARLVMASDAMQRGPSELYASGRWRVASEEAIVEESLAQRAFAAAPPNRARIGRENLIAMMESRIGQTPRALESTAAVLAQPSIAGEDVGRGTKGPDKPKAEEYLWAEWIADRELIRGSWLNWIEDPQEQQRHALYAVNLRPVESAEELFQRLRAPGDEASTASDRLYWVLQKAR